MKRATETNPTRRAVLGNVAACAVVAPAIPYAALALAEPADPIFALIEAHRNALAEFDRVFNHNQDLEESLSRDERESDPRWSESERELAAVTGRPGEIAATIGGTMPATAAGAVALLAYSAEYVATIDWAKDWPTADVFRNTAAALSKIAA